MDPTQLQRCCVCFFSEVCPPMAAFLPPLPPLLLPTRMTVLVHLRRMIFPLLPRKKKIVLLIIVLFSLSFSLSFCVIVLFVSVVWLFFFFLFFHFCSSFFFSFPFFSFFFFLFFSFILVLLFHHLCHFFLLFLF